MRQLRSDRRAPSPNWRDSRSLGGMLFLSAVLSTACSSQENVDPADENIIPQVPIPPANGPKLIAQLEGVSIRDRPSLAGTVIGTLRAGAQVARGEQPYSKKNCSGGWYPIRPRGWVCVGTDATIDLQSPIARVMADGPQLDAALPYRYGRIARGAGVLYGTLPSTAEQLAAEPKLRKRKERPVRRLGAAANDVPLDSAGYPEGPPIVQADAAGVGPDGFRDSDDFFIFPGPATPPEPLTIGISLLGADPSARTTKVLKRKSGVAIVRSFVLGAGEEARRMGLLPSGRFIGIDRLIPALGTTWHGIDLREGNLPVAFSIRAGIRPWLLNKQKAEPVDDEFEPQQAILLTGRYRTISGHRYYATRDDTWVRARDIILIHKRHKYPDWARGNHKWLDISLANQTLVAWEGRKPVFATLISSGEDRLGDPKSGPATIRGVFKVQSKHVTGAVDSREVGQAFNVTDVPWMVQFADGFSITGSYWLDRLGEAQSHHNIALAPIDAHWFWHWSDPQVPDGWHSMVPNEDQPNTTIYVHK